MVIYKVYLQWNSLYVMFGWITINFHLQKYTGAQLWIAVTLSSCTKSFVLHCFHNSKLFKWNWLTLSFVKMTPGRTMKCLIKMMSLKCCILFHFWAIVLFTLPMDFLRQYTVHKDPTVIPVTAISHFFGSKTSNLYFD